MLRTIVTCGALAALATDAHAIERLNALQSSCERVQQVVARDGEVILRFPSTRVAGLTLYTRFVRGDLQCDSREMADKSSISTARGEVCKLYVCAPKPRSGSSS